MNKVQQRMDAMIILALLITYLVVLLKITIFRESSSGVQNVNLVPIRTIFEYFHSILRGNIVIGFSNVFGNITMFIPLGYIFPSLFPILRTHMKVLIFVAVFSVAIESCQYLFSRGAADIDDVILNIFGGMLGYWIHTFIAKYFQLKRLNIFILALMIAVTFISFHAFDNYKFLIDHPAPSNRSSISRLVI